MKALLDKHKFSDKATEIILSALYQYSNPINLFTATADEIDRQRECAVYVYQNDPLTHNRVKGIVAMLVQILDDCFKEV